MACVRRGAVVLGVAAAIALAALPAYGQGVLNKSAAVCQQAIGREGQKFKKAKLKAWQRCLDGILLGKGCDPLTRDAMIRKAEDAFAGNAEKRCLFKPDLVFGAPPAAVGFARSCDLEAGPIEPAEETCRALPVDDVRPLVRCLVCWKEAELHELLQILYPCLGGQVPAGSDLDCGTPPAACPSDRATVACLRAVAKAGIDFFLAEEKALEQCLDRVNRGSVPGPCPDAVAQQKIAAAEQQKKAQIQKCPQLPPWWDRCPEACDLSIDSLSAITDCLDRAGGEIADETICQQYPGARNASIPCPPAETTSTTTTTTTTTTLPPPPTPCTEATRPDCNGACPSPTAECIPVGAGCGCVERGCEAAGVPPGCGGFCPPEAPSCVNDNGVCRCVAGITAPCDDGQNPTCDGICPQGQNCVASGTGCACALFACHFDFFNGDPVCSGICPPQFPVCRFIGGANCRCTAN